MLHTDEGELASCLEIARNALTHLIIRNVPSEFVKWNHKITAVRHGHNATTGVTAITLDLGANRTATYDFVSAPTVLLTDIKPLYSGAQFVTVTLRNASTKYPHLAKLNDSGTLCALGGGHRGPQDSIRMYAAVSTPHEHWATACQHGAVGLAGPGEGRGRRRRQRRRPRTMIWFCPKMADRRWRTC